MLGLPAMDAAQALADLTEISSQIEAAVLASADGTASASTFADEARGNAVAAAAAELLRAAEEAPGGGAEELLQVQAATPEGSVFVVRDGQRLVAAVTAPEPTVGLVFYDLKTCLRLAGETPPASEAKAASRRRKKQEGEGDGEG
jgi:predicted regulator of Ras-like GTPase activity (Roadblock/LC7/MglB family)